MSATEPVTVLVGEPGREALADVLIEVADRRHTATRCAELHGRYPGLTLALVISDNHFVASFRDGMELTVTRTTTAAWTLDEVTAVARRLYRRWLTSRRPRAA
jgi:hypothetical protein